jgi:mannose/fructose/N-acetylgalactosamine-specific phosphotransferase system component IID
MSSKASKRNNKVLLRIIRKQNKQVEYVQPIFESVIKLIIAILVIIACFIILSKG